MKDEEVRVLRSLDELDREARFQLRERLFAAMIIRNRSGDVPYTIRFYRKVNPALISPVETRRIVEANPDPPRWDLRIPELDAAAERMSNLTGESDGRLLYKLHLVVIPEVYWEMRYWSLLARASSNEHLHELLRTVMSEDLPPSSPSS